MEEQSRTYILEASDLSVSFETDAGEVQAVRDVSLSLKEGEVLAIVGESGCGKSVLCKSLMKMLPGNARIKSGKILANGIDITGYKERDMAKLRGTLFSMVFQDPMSALDPTVRIGRQIAEAIRMHNRTLSREEIGRRVTELLELVGIDHVQERCEWFPHQFSGGMRQRIIIAIALACNPKLIVADEPTTALDVTVQAQILDLLKDITKESNAGVIIITHDLGVVASLCDRISIMYGGNIMEEGTTDEIFYDPKHPYTKGLLNSIANSNVDHREPLKPIPGTPPDLLKLGDQCPFASRCSEAMEICTKASPLVTEFGETHKCKCWLHCKERWHEVLKGEDAYE